MRSNGYIRGMISGEPQVNEYGEPIAAATSFSDKIPACITLNSDTRKGIYEDGLFRQFSAIILIEGSALSDFPYNSVELTLDGCALGVKRVLTVAAMSSLGRLQICV